MGKLEDGFSLREAKKQIAEATKGFEKRIMSAKNNFERLLVYRDMVKILNEEIFALGNTIEKLINLNDEQVADSVVEMEKSRSGLVDLLVVIRAEIKLVFDTAYEIQEAMIRSHTLKERVFEQDINSDKHGFFEISQ